MREHFGVGVGAKLVAAFSFELFAERGVIFNHTVVHQCDFSALVKMWMRVFVGDLAVGGPTRMADAIMAGGRLLGHQFREVRDPSSAFPRLDLFAVYDGDACGIVTTVFKAAQTIEKNGRCFCLPDISNNSTHNFRSRNYSIFSARGALRTRRRTQRLSSRAAQTARDLTKDQRCRASRCPPPSQSAAHFVNVLPWARPLPPSRTGVVCAGSG